MEDTITTDCYYCKNLNETDPETKINPAVSGPLFPFCCEDHKEKWGVEHFGIKSPGPKKHTIEECQQLLLKMRDDFRKRRGIVVDEEVDIAVVGDIFNS